MLLTEDAEQNLKATNTSLNNNTLTVHFTRFIISPDTTQDLNLTGCRSVAWVYGINNIPINNLLNLEFGIFSIPLCLQLCQGTAMVSMISKINVCRRLSYYPFCNKLHSFNSHSYSKHH